MAHTFYEIFREYDRIRAENEREASHRRIEAYAMVDGLEELDHSIRTLGYEAAKAAIADGASHAISDALRELKTLEGVKESLLLKAGLPKDYLEPIYTCKQCNDKGYLENGEHCLCLKQKLTSYLHRSSHIERQIEKNNFGNFRLDIYSDLPFGESGISPRENMTKILETAHEFIDSFWEKNDVNLLFYGPTGLGKTFLSHAIAAEILNQGAAVVYETAFGLVRIFEEKIFEKKQDEEVQLSYNSIFNADLLIIDDLGTEFSNSFTNAQLFNIVNTRLIEGKKTIISTNLTPQEISTVYGDRIFSRIFHRFVPMAFIGNDLRWEIDE